MRKYFHILQANLRKTPETQLSLLNDEDLHDFGLLLIQEPHCWRIDGQVITAPQHHAYWTPYVPAVHHEEGRWPFRSMIWAHRDLAVKQVPTSSPDITAAMTEVEGRKILAISVYIPQQQEDVGDALSAYLDCIRGVIEKTRREQSPQQIEVIIAGDFNRHDQLWGGDEVGTSPRQGEGEAIIDLMSELELNSLLPRGTITYEGARGQSTIDLVMASTSLSDDCMQCDTHPNEHGSDHRSIQTSFNLLRPETTLKPRLLLRHAAWDRIRQAVTQQLEQLPDEVDDLDRYTDHFVSIVTETVQKHTPYTKPTSYTKRWWTADLTQLRRNYTYWRNQARSHRRQGVGDDALEARVLELRREYHRSMRVQKKQHWDTFLEDRQNIWQACRYLQPDSTAAFAKISALKTGERETVEDDEGIARTLITAFFPEGRAVSATLGDPEDYGQLPTVPLTMIEVERAIHHASSWKAPGTDSMPAVVWQKLWAEVKEVIFRIFRQSLATGRLPRAFKVAKIVPLRKPDKRDYEQPGAYRPISLLSTLGKALEAIIAERISYLAETHHLLPNNHFGARKSRSTAQALMMLQERIYDAWRERKILSLVSFDVKGAYNGVNKDILLHRLRARQVPEMLVQWVANFCSDRRATVVVNGHESATYDLAHPGLPQGSPLSPILFLFFNADLVQNVINKHQGAMAFVDDYSAWVTGQTAEGNTQKIQGRTIPRAEAWEASSGATFESIKTTFIHFSRNPRHLSDTPLAIRDKLVKPQGSAKILGMILDQQLRFYEHYAHVAKRGLRAVMALKRLRALQPNTTRQLFIAAVAPTIDYASFIWSARANERTLKLLEPIQRIAAQAIVGTFRTVALGIAQAEAGIEPLHRRWQRQAHRTWIRWHTLPPKHPFWKSKRHIDMQNTRFVSPLQLHAQHYRSTDVSRVETIESYSVAPWTDRLTVDITEDREHAIEQAQSAMLDVHVEAFFTDGSARNNRVGIGVAHRTFAFHQTIGIQDDLNVYFAELFAIYQAVINIHRHMHSCPEVRRKTMVLFTDSQAALKSLASPRQQSGQFILRSILDEVQALGRIQGTKIEFRWVPAHAGVKLNEAANEQARIATEKDSIPQQPHLPRLATAARREDTNYLTKREMTATEKDSFRRHIDQAIPGKHTRTLYDRLSKKDASVLAQLRTGKCRLNHYLARINAAQTEICQCGREAETVRHFLFRCPRWRTTRNDLQLTSQPRWGEHAYCLGAWSDQRGRDGQYVHGEKEKWKPDMSAIKNTLNFVKATRRLEWVPKA
jgi:ribonuclease HI